MVLYICLTFIITRMKSDIDEMLHLAADIAEELLAIKDNDGEVSHGLCAKIDRLAGLAVANIRESATLTERIELITEKIIRNRAEEIRDGADAPIETEHDEAEALIENARKEAMESEDGSNQTECHNTDHTQESIAASAEFEESADADEDIQDTTNGDVYELTGKQLRGIFSLNDIFYINGHFLEVPLQNSMLHLTRLPVSPMSKN